MPQINYKTLLIVIFSLLASLLFADSTTAASNNSPITRVKLFNGSHSISIPPNFLAYGFSWSHDNSFTYSWDGKIYHEPHLSDSLIGDENIDNYKSEIIFSDGTEKTIYIKGLPAQDSIDLILVSDILTDSAQESVGQKTFAVASLSSGHQVNLNSGANYTEIPIVSRSSWGANEDFMTWKPEYRKVNKFVVHHTAWPNNPSDYKATVRGIYNYHATGNEWGDIGYNYLIDPNGKIYEGRTGGDAVIGAHAYRNNSAAIGIAFMGTHTSAMPTDAALNAFRSLVLEKSLLHGITLKWQGSGATVFGHRDMPHNNTACPGTKLYDSLDSIVASIEQTRQAALATSEFHSTRLASISATTGYTDMRLKLNFANPGTSSQNLSAIPKNSGILKVEPLDGENAAVVTIKSITKYDGSTYQDSFDRLQMLHTIFSLDTNFSGIEFPLLPDIIGHQIAAAGDDASNNLIALEFSRPIQLGNGNLVLKLDDDIVETIDVADTNASNRTVTVILTTNMIADNTYQLEICNTCYRDLSDNYYAGSEMDLPISSTTITSTPVYRFWSPTYRAHFYTANVSERNKVINSYSVWDYEKEAFEMYDAGQCNSENLPVYRFWSAVFRGHFYTTKEDEKVKLITNDKNWEYEKITFCAPTSTTPGAVAVHRFWSPNFKHHFYTISDSEKNKLITSDPNWEYEGISFYAFPLD